MRLSHSFTAPPVVSVVSFVFFVSFVSFASLIASPRPCLAQNADAVGVRAQGMGGAFTAVADDSTATFWNPAGLATGAYFNATVEYGRSPDNDTDRRGFSLAFPALGVSYYRLPVSEIRAAATTTATSAGSRQDPGALDVRVVDLSQFGVTAGQSIGRHLVLGSTLKLVRAAGDSHAGLDVGAMAALGIVRLGVIVRNAREITLGAGDQAITLTRQVRLGAAVTTTARSGVGGLTVSVDADARQVPSVTGNERRIAAGAEVWTPRRTFGVRAGLSGSTLGEGRRALSAGASVALRTGIYADGQITGGSDVSRRGWGGALRLTF